MVLSITKHTVPKVHFHYLVWLRNNWIHFLTSAILQGVRANVFRSYNKVSLPYREIGSFWIPTDEQKETGMGYGDLRKEVNVCPPPSFYTILASEVFLWISYQISGYSGTSGMNWSLMMGTFHTVFCCCLMLEMDDDLDV